GASRREAGPSPGRPRAPSPPTPTASRWRSAPRSSPPRCPTSWWSREPSRMSSDHGIPYAGDRIDEPATRSPACPACGRHSQPEAAFCAFCGTALVHQRIAGPPVFAAVAAAIEGRSAYDVLHEVGGLFESLGAVFEGVSQAPATLVALFPPKEDAAAVAARAALDAAS